VVDKVALGRVSLKVFPFSPGSIIPPSLHTHSFIHSFIKPITDAIECQQATASLNSRRTSGSRSALLVSVKSSALVLTSAYLCSLLNIPFSDIIDQGWPRRGMRDLPVKNNIQAACMHKRLTANGVLIDFLKKGDS
jgi:hypothetical protein